ncbi:Protein of unknown function [Propionibacterium freudenreichii]
MATSH